MSRRPRAFAFLFAAALALALVITGSALGAGRPPVAALQVGLSARGVYAGWIVSAFAYASPPSPIVETAAD